MAPQVKEAETKKNNRKENKQDESNSLPRRSRSNQSGPSRGPCRATSRRWNWRRRSTPTMTRRSSSCPRRPRNPNRLHPMPALSPVECIHLQTQAQSNRPSVSRPRLIARSSFNGFQRPCSLSHGQVFLHSGKNKITNTGSIITQYVTHNQVPQTGSIPLELFHSNET